MCSVKTSDVNFKRDCVCGCVAIGQFWTKLRLCIACLHFVFVTLE